MAPNRLKLFTEGKGKKEQTIILDHSCNKPVDNAFNTHTTLIPQKIGIRTIYTYYLGHSPYFPFSL